MLNFESPAALHSYTGSKVGQQCSAYCDPRLTLLMFITAPRIERHEHRFVTRDIGSGRSGVTRRIEAA